MKLRVIATFVLTLVLSVNVAFAQNGSIGIFSDEAGASCNIDANVGMFTTFYVVAVLGGSTAGGITGAEFSLQGDGAGAGGLPADWTQIGPFFTLGPAGFGSETWSLAASDITNLQGGVQGVSMATPACIGGGTGVWTLYSIDALVGSVVTDHNFKIDQKFPPANPTLPFPSLFLCDGPSFTQVVVGGGEAFMNGTGADCQVAVEETSWSNVKALYAN